MSLIKLLTPFLLAVAVGLLAAPVASVAAPRAGIAQSGPLRVHYAVHGDLSAGTPLVLLHGAFMSGDAMDGFVKAFGPARPLIVVDLRGHGRTGDAPGPITYEDMADDVAAVLRKEGVRTAHVLGYSMGGAAGLQLAIRHPDLVDKLVVVSAGYRLDGMYPEVIEGIAKLTPETFKGTPMEASYKKLAPRPQDFPVLVEKIKKLDATPFDWTPGVKALRPKIMIIVGDYDILALEHAVKMFRLAGGGDPKTAAVGVLTAAPPARLAILPATSHIGAVADPGLIEKLVTPFLKDETPPMPPGFF